MDPIEIDGSFGEGGGQVLRTSLALSLVTGKPVRIRHVRAKRSKPGLLHQHLTALKAAARVGCAKVEGDVLGSGEVVFEPGAVVPGHYELDVGTAGSANLVLQTILPALITADAPSTLVLSGGTHNMASPPYDFLEKAYAPLLARMGPELRLELDRHGFYPAGGGRFRASIRPAKLAPLELRERGEARSLRAEVLLSRLPTHVARRELDAIAEVLEVKDRVVREVDSRGPGNVAMVVAEHEHVTEVFTGFGKRGRRAEDVGESVAREAKAWLEAEVPVGEHLADQLMLLLALAGGGAFRTLPLSGHATTQPHTIGAFLDVPIRTEEKDGVATVHVG